MFYCIVDFSPMCSKNKHKMHIFTGLRWFNGIFLHSSYTLFYLFVLCLQEGRTTVGTKDADEKPDLGKGCNYYHAF